MQNPGPVATMGGATQPHGTHHMTMKPHPITGVLINEIETRSGAISAAERQTARLLLNDGHARWVVAAMLGRFPLAFDGTGKKPTRPRKAATGSDLSASAAKHDPRQSDIFALLDDLFGPDDPCDMA